MAARSIKLRDAVARVAPARPSYLRVLVSPSKAMGPETMKPIDSSRESQVLCNRLIVPDRPEPVSRLSQRRRTQGWLLQDFSRSRVQAPLQLSMN